MIERPEAGRQTGPVRIEAQATPLTPELTLRESLVGKKGKLTKDLTRVARMINYLDITLEQKRTLFFYHLWHESGSLAPIKEFVEVRDDFAETVIDRVLKDDTLVKSYDGFYKRYTEHKKEGSKAYRQRIREIVALRGKLNIPEISRVTGYSEDYIRSVFKRLVKRGKVKPMNKREVVERTPGYEIYIDIRSGIERLINSGQRYTDNELAEVLSKELEQDITVQQVKRQKRLLLRDGKIVRRVNQFK